MIVWLNDWFLDLLLIYNNISMSYLVTCITSLAAFFRCYVCHATATVEIDRGRIAEPSICRNCNTNHSMDLIHNRCQFSDKQMVKLQESPGEKKLVVILISNMFHTEIRIMRWRLFKLNHEDRINHELMTQGFLVSFIVKYSYSPASSLWPRVQHTMTKYISIFIIGPSITILLFQSPKYNLIACRFKLQKFYWPWDLNWRYDWVFLSSRILSCLTELSTYAGLLSFFRRQASQV